MFIFRHSSGYSSSPPSSSSCSSSSSSGRGTLGYTSNQPQYHHHQMSTTSGHYHQQNYHNVDVKSEEMFQDRRVRMNQVQRNSLVRNSKDFDDQVEETRLCFECLIMFIFQADQMYPRSYLPPPPSSLQPGSVVSQFYPPSQPRPGSLDANLAILRKEMVSNQNKFMFIYTLQCSN